MNIVGLGSAGCGIVDRFGEHEQYKTYKIDSDIYTEQLNYFQLKKQDSFQEYEDHTYDLKDYFRNITEEVCFAVAGSGDTPGATLWVLEQLKRYSPSVLYMRPDVELLNVEGELKERLLRGVLQEYARSAALNRIYLVDNAIVENFLGDIPVTKYYDSLNDIIVSTLHMINVFENSNPLIGSLQRPQECNRIATFGIADLESGEENLFYSLDLTRERCYYYAINKKRLEEDGTLIKKIKSQVKSKIQENIRVSYGVFPTEYEQDYVFCKAYTSQIQLKKE